MFWIYYIFALSKPPSWQQIYFQNQCFKMWKRSKIIQVNWPLSWECWTIQSDFKTTFAHRARTCSTHKFLQWQHFILVLFNWQIQNLAYLWSYMLSTAPSWMHFRYNTWGTLDALQFLSAEHSFCCLFGNKIHSYLLLASTWKWCMDPMPHCPTGWTIQQAAISEMLSK